MANIKQLTANDLGHKLKEKTDMRNQEIREAAEQTKEKYSPLITNKKNALLLYAREEENIQLIEKTPPDLDIENIVPDMNEVTLTCKVEKVNKFSYRKDGEKKKGCDITLKDNTGRISMMLWGEHVEKVDQSYKEEKVLIENAYSSKYKGETQINYGEETKIENI